jgi:hypothetical protein
MSRIARIAALALPVLLVCVLATTGAWRVHDGRVERVGQATTPAAASLPAPAPAPGSTDQVAFVDHLSFSVPWEAWAGLIVLCILPAVGSLAAWSGTRRRHDSAFVAAGGAS